MAIFSPASIWRIRNAKRRAQAQPPRKRILYRGVALSLLLAALASIASVAQESTPEIVPLGKNRHAPKKDLGPRALALLKLTHSGSATLIPVMIEVNGKFYDAASYKADPVPMALESGTVYEGEKTGVSAGLFTVNSALHSLAANAEVPWLATGAWIAEGTKPKNEMKAEAVPRGIETTDAPPRLTKPTSPSAGSAPATPPASSPSTSTSSPSTTKPEEKTGEKKDDKAAEPKSSTPSATAAAPAAPASPPPATSDDSYRPTLRRGKPTAPMPDFDVPGYAKPNSAKGSDQGSDGAKASTPISPTEPVELITAISDAQGPELRSFGYQWEEGAEAERLKQMTELATTQLRAYVAERAKGQIPATAAARTTTARTATARKSAAKPAKPVEPIFENVQMHTFDLWGSNQPVLVLSADAHLPPPASQPASEAVDLPSAPLQYKILLVTRTDIYGNLHTLYSGVTDRFHLDVIPQLDLIDAVDADGDGRGELLFHKTTDSANGYAIYRAASDTLWKMFDTVNPE